MDLSHLNVALNARASIVYMLFSVASWLRNLQHTLAGLGCESYLSNTKISSDVKILRMQISLVRQPLLVMCLHTVLSQSFGNSGLGHKVDARRSAGTPKMYDNDSGSSGSSKTNVNRHNVCINTPKHVFLFTSSTVPNSVFSNSRL